MPSFNFTVVPKSKQRNYKKNNNLHKLIVEKSEGVVFIDLDANYSVKVNEISYKIHPDNYTCKNHEILYYQGICEEGHRVCYHRTKSFQNEFNTKLFLPFMAGCVVKGEIVRDLVTNEYYFVIQKYLKNTNNPIAKQALDFYRENYETIYNKIKDKIIE